MRMLTREVQPMLEIFVNAGKLKSFERLGVFCVARANREDPKGWSDSSRKGPVCDSKRLGHHFESFQTLSMMHLSGGKKG